MCEDTKLKEPPFIGKMRRTLEWVASSRQDNESFLAGVNAGLKLVAEHYRSTPMMNPALVGHKRVAAHRANMKNLADKLQQCQQERNRLTRIFQEVFPDGVAEADKVRSRIEGYRTTIKQMSAHQQRQQGEQVSKKERNNIKAQRDNALYLLNQAQARIRELEQAA